MKTKYDDIEKMFQETQMSHLIDSGFMKELISTEVMDIKPEENTKYWTPSIYPFSLRITPVSVKKPHMKFIL